MNYTKATCSKDGKSFQIVLTGKRPSLAHSIVLATIEQTYEASQSFKVPRTTGAVAGSEIPSEKGHYKYEGKLEFNEGRLTVDLHYIDTDRNLLRPLTWNGTYQLESCAGAPQ